MTGRSDRQRPAVQLVDDLGRCRRASRAPPPTSKCQASTGLKAQVVIIWPIAPDSNRTRSDPVSSAVSP